MATELHQHPLLAANVGECDHCAGKIPESGSFPADMGVMKVHCKMVFCSNRCRTAMVGNMLDSEHVAADQKAHIKKAMPGAAAQYSKVQSSIQESAVVAKTTAGKINTAAAAIGAPMAAEPINAEWLTKLKRSLTGNHYAVDTVSMAEDIIRRLDWHAIHSKPDGILSPEVVTDGQAVLKRAMEQLVTEGISDVAGATEALNVTIENVMTLESESRAFWDYKGHPLMHDVAHWHEEALGKDLGLLLRSVMDPKVGGANVAKLDMHIQAVIHRVITERGEAGYTFIERFFGVPSSA